MGKVRRPRRKFHLEAKTPLQPFSSADLAFSATKTTPELLIKPQENVFKNLNIRVDKLNTLHSIGDDLSVKSFKSSKSDTGKALSKKDKLKMRREMLMKKFEVVNQKQMKDKRKKTPVVGDLNPLHDALPSLESLLKSKVDVQYNKKNVESKKRGIEKTKKLKKNHIQGIKIFQHILKNKQFQKDPQLAISQQIQAILEHENK